MVTELSCRYKACAGAGKSRVPVVSSEVKTAVIVSPSSLSLPFTMKTAAVLLAVLSVAAAVPYGHFRRGGYNQGGYASGNANANVVSGSQGGYYGNSQITQVSASAQGSSRGNGYSNNRASASNIGISSPFGNQQYSNTNAVSNQGSFGGGFGGGFRRPHYG